MTTIMTFLHLTKFDWLLQRRALHGFTLPRHFGFSQLRFDTFQRSQATTTAYQLFSAKMPKTQIIDCLPLGFAYCFAEYALLVAT